MKVLCLLICKNLHFIKHACSETMTNGTMDSWFAVKNETDQQRLQSTHGKARAMKRILVACWVISYVLYALPDLAALLV